MTVIDLKQMGRRIADARAAKGLSTQGLATKMEISKGAVGHWETGKNAIRAPELGQLCQILGVSADELLFGVRRWPFSMIDFDAVAGLDQRERGLLEGAMLLAAAQIGLEIKQEAA